MGDKPLQKRATTVYDFSQDDMYHAWVQNNRHTANTARELGMNHQTLYYHVRAHNFHARYEAEFTNSAAAMRRVAMVDASNKMGDMINVLYSIATDGEQKAYDRVLAVKAFMEIFPKDQQVVEETPRFIEASARVLSAAEVAGGTAVSDEQVEQEILAALESNVQNTAPSRK